MAALWLELRLGLQTVSELLSQQPQIQPLVLMVLLLLLPPPPFRLTLKRMTQIGTSLSMMMVWWWSWWRMMTSQKLSCWDSIQNQRWDQNPSELRLKSRTKRNSQEMVQNQTSPNQH